MAMGMGRDADGGRACSRSESGWFEKRLKQENAKSADRKI